jgi:penicillin-binding protein 1A
MSIGIPATVNMAKNLGLTTPVYPNYASALGASEVTLMELTRAYSVFPNQGALVEPIFIERIEDRDGRILMESHPQKHQVLNAATAQTMTQLLLGVVERGTGTRVKVLGRPVGGKTGTTNRTRDAWFIGFTPAIITGCWVGMDNETSLGPKETGSQAAAPIFISYMKQALKGLPAENFQGGAATILAKGGETKDEAADDEAGGNEEAFYPEEENGGAIEERTPNPPQASSQQFFKDDLGQ